MCGAADARGAHRAPVHPAEGLNAATVVQDAALLVRAVRLVVVAQRVRLRGLVAEPGKSLLNRNIERKSI